MNASLSEYALDVEPSGYALLTRDDAPRRPPMAAGEFSRGWKLAAAICMVFALAACGGGGSGGPDDVDNAGSSSDSADGGGGDGGEGGDDSADNGGSDAPAGDHITATLSGHGVKSATIDVNGFWVLNGEAGNALQGKGTGSPAPLIWSLQHIKAAVGDYTCGADAITIAFTDPSFVDPAQPMDAWKMQSTTAHDQAACTLTVEKVDANVMEGTFTATTVATNGLEVVKFVFTEGTFKVPFQAQ